MPGICHINFDYFQAILNDTPWLQTGNIILYVMMDLFIGILLSFYITRTFPNLYEIAHRHIEDLLGIVLQILGWLSGVPAGLKLNASLNSLLGRFFSYNLHLWRNYISKYILGEKKCYIIKHMPLILIFLVFQ